MGLELLDEAFYRGLKRRLHGATDEGSGQSRDPPHLLPGVLVSRFHGSGLARASLSGVLIAGVTIAPSSRA